MSKIFFIILISYLLVLVQTSLSPHFAFSYKIPNLILISVILFNLFEAPKEKAGLFFAFFGGFFLDIFSENFLGFWILILLIVAFFIKLFLRKYVRIPITKGI